MDRELSTIQRFVALATQFKETGVKIIPALKLSRKEGQTWNKRPLDAARLKAASEVQRSLRMIASPSRVKKEDIEAFKAIGYKSVDETQVVSEIDIQYSRDVGRSENPEGWGSSIVVGIISPPG